MLFQTLDDELSAFLGNNILMRINRLPVITIIGLSMKNYTIH